MCRAGWGKGRQKDYGLITTLAEKQIKVTLDGFSEEEIKWKSTVSYALPLLALFLQRQHNRYSLGCLLNWPWAHNVRTVLHFSSTHRSAFYYLHCIGPAVSLIRGYILWGSKEGWFSLWCRHTAYASLMFEGITSVLAIWMARGNAV